MAGELSARKKRDLGITATGMSIPAIVAGAGGEASKRFLEFFAAQIRNANTREAYMRAVTDFFDRCSLYDIARQDSHAHHEPIKVGQAECLHFLSSFST